jgi:hypothetical protein
VTPFEEMLQKYVECCVAFVLHGTSFDKPAMEAALLAHVAQLEADRDRLDALERLVADNGWQRCEVYVEHGDEPTDARIVIEFPISEEPGATIYSGPTLREAIDQAIKGGQGWARFAL